METLMVILILIVLVMLWLQKAALSDQIGELRRDILNLQGQITSQVSDSDWKNFSDTAIASRFSGGYTELNAQGRWLDKTTGKTISENTIVVLLMGKNSKFRSRQIDSIAQLYTRRFNQDAVMRFDSKGYLKFVSK